MAWQGLLHGLKRKDAVVDGDHGVALDEVGPGLFDALLASLSMILVSEVLFGGVSLDWEGLSSGIGCSIATVLDCCNIWVCVPAIAGRARADA